MSFGSISDLWNKWNIRGFVILSLSLQVVLLLCAPLRKKITSPPIVFLLWSAYLMADSVAISGIGLISHSQGNLSALAAEVDGALRAFWVSFLLLHLGGPDTITAFSLEDNSLWRRHLLSLIFQVSVTIYVFVQICPTDKSLVIPTILVFLSGVIKNAERILALNFSSLTRLKKSLVKIDKLRRNATLELIEELEDLRYIYFDEEESIIAESNVVKHAYYFFEIFKVFVVDIMSWSVERLTSREYFYKVSAVDALRVISVELNFIYEMLHTKALTIRSKWSYICRFISFIDIAMAFVLFNRFKKHQLSKLDVEITYILLFGGIALDVITLLMLVFSDWTIASIMHYKRGPSKLDSFLHGLISTTDGLRKPRFATCEVEPNANAMYTVLDTPFIFRRWSESICACNLFSTILKQNQRKVYKHDRHWGIIAFSNICSFPFSVAEKIISYLHQILEKVIDKDSSIFLEFPRYMSKNPFVNKLWIFIFEEVRRKSKDAYNPTEARKIFEARGDLFLQGRLGGIDCGNLVEHVTGVTYDCSVMIWHIATEILYNIEKPTERNDQREFSKIFSDYLLYLLVNQPNVMSVVAGFAQLTLLELMREVADFKQDAKGVEGLCKTLHEDTPMELLDLNSPLRQGIVLAHKMKSCGERKWEVISGVWVEMLSYAAGHIKGEAHVQVLSQGGELLAFVWLLMAHFGCLNKPEWGTYEYYMFDMHLKTKDHGDQEEDDESTVVSMQLETEGNGDQEEDDESTVVTELV
ncbi:hypothetical protein ACJRO7_000158 [Eucalyptus globulus]|uniref:DUF4220 domain-containing protein n=1 Tax=Eucalyptus globulus TaxID=34317 RepID=A0ABD3LLN6_EUCGL